MVAHDKMLQPNVGALHIGTSALATRPTRAQYGGKSTKIPPRSCPLKDEK